MDDSSRHGIEDRASSSAQIAGNRSNNVIAIMMAPCTATST